MITRLLIIFFFLFSFSSYNQNMTIEKLDEVITKISEKKATKEDTKWSFLINEVPIIVVADATHNRMRIISPITEVSRLSEELKSAALMANFHTALDIKYAIANNILWSAFIHPLKELSEEQLIDAFSQVYYGNVNFGTTFSSSSLIFPGGSKKEQPKENIKQKLLERI